MTDLATAANGLRTSYGDKTVLDGVDIHVHEGRPHHRPRRGGRPMSTHTLRASPTMLRRNPLPARHPDTTPEWAARWVGGISITFGGPAAGAGVSRRGRIGSRHPIHRVTPEGSTT
ncbi:hypothetical protein ACIRPK_30010 [Kitasatospora sp. NPDC101801]|uniref:hypothetical protein n=1 Tax=Kitasatospora sp. NPDC101801 TaxID=3364103 RepID=UPI0038179EE5